ncbi:hypothetical protein RND71_041034 [Anisodus tanguticus]|uniref:3-hydroxyisobutyrate dehydrogenase-like NAD-binding domain-containing protein n=1 Tax=Anisodus tanguticus TaxID=243964 RepID=A0AAE1QWV6_9SOLA|nr:hypothetical protein RND71_041034 [Anisodus tanguticus]
MKGPAMIKNSYPPAFPLKHQPKDMRLALALGDENAVPMPVAAAANERNRPFTEVKQKTEESVISTGHLNIKQETDEEQYAISVLMEQLTQDDFTSKIL